MQTLSASSSVRALTLWSWAVRRRDHAGEKTAYQVLTGAAPAQNIVIDLTAPDVGCSLAERTLFTTIKLEQLEKSGEKIEPVRTAGFPGAVLLMLPNKSHASPWDYPCSYYNHDIEFFALLHQSHPHRTWFPGKAESQEHRGLLRHKAQHLFSAKWHQITWSVSPRRGGEPRPAGETSSWSQAVFWRAPIWGHRRAEGAHTRWGVLFHLAELNYMYKSWF